MTTIKYIIENQTFGMSKTLTVFWLQHCGAIKAYISSG